MLWPEGPKMFCRWYRARRATREFVGTAGPASKGLCVDFGRHPVLRDIHLDIARGQTLAVIGESGCGKTVLLKTIIGLLAAHARRACSSTAGTWRN